MGRNWLLHRMGVKTKRYGGAKKAATKGNRKLATVSTVKRMINKSSETKFVYSAFTTITSNLLSNSSLFTLLNPLTQGDTDSNRTGDKVRFHYLTMNLRHIIYDLQGDDLVYRVNIIRVKNPRGSAPTASTLVVNGGTAQNPEEIWDEVLYDFSSRYEVLYDSGVKIIHKQISNNYNLSADYISIPCDFTTDYSLSNVGTIADIDQNALYLYVRTNNSTANQHVVQYSYKLTYKDM